MNRTGQGPAHKGKTQFSHQSLPLRNLHKPLRLIHQGTDKRSKKHSLTVVKTKTILQKKQTVISQMKRKDKTPEKQLNEMEIGNLPEKEFRIMIVKMIQDRGKRNGEKKLRRCKKCLPKTYKN